MTRRNWKTFNPRTMAEAIEGALEHAHQRHNRSVDRVAELAGEKSKWTVYGWEREASIPGRKILAFEHATGCAFITRYLAHAHGMLLIDMPIGRMPDGEDIKRLQGVLNEAVGALLGFAHGQMDADQVGAEINAALEGLAWHRANVAKCSEPELEFAPHE